MDEEHRHKRARLSDIEVNASSRLDERASRRSISPPGRKNVQIPLSSSTSHGQIVDASIASNVPMVSSKLVSSPIQLNTIAELPASSNVDTVSLRDILGDPLISECWLFNYLFDVDFLLSHFDEDVRGMVQVKLVHGSWKKEDSNKAHIDEAVRRHPNIQSITAHMPEPFGTHHSKMIVSFRHDDQAQVILLTANFVPGDWSMSQAVWRSPLLPIQATSAASNRSSEQTLPPTGSGARFKSDLLAYFHGYSRLGRLTTRLESYNFSAVRGALIASLPRKQKISKMADERQLWGLPKLRRVLQAIPSMYISDPPVQTTDNKTSNSKSLMGVPHQPQGAPQIVIQISSVATIGDKWPRDFLFPSLSNILHSEANRLPRPQFSIVFPTADEIRRSVNGYGSGGSIHMRMQSNAQLKQLDHLRPMLCHWAGDEVAPSSTSEVIREAGRRRAAPHIKTYVRFSDSTMTKIDWAMMTSANLSNQAWGSETKAGEVRVCSYEIGIVVWPALWDDKETGKKAEMVPVFKKDTPEGGYLGEDVIKVGWRMPYDLPLIPYAKDEMPWCASAPCQEPDWMGRSWPGFGTG